MDKLHNYTLQLKWIGNTGQGTKRYTSYDRAYTISARDKYTDIQGSSDPSFRGDPNKYNPEELFLASLSSCHMLWYLHLCASNNIVVISYMDNPEGTMVETSQGGGRFKEVTLYPTVVIKDPHNLEMARALHTEANDHCFIANSCNFPIVHTAEILVESTQGYIQ